MSKTHFSGPVVSEEGFEGSLVGTVLGNNAFQTITGDGAITIPTGDQAMVLLTKGSAAAISIAAPAIADNGKVVIVKSNTAFAHVITSPVDGFNAKGSSGTATAATPFTGTLMLVANAGHWYTFGQNLWTIA